MAKRASKEEEREMRLLIFKEDEWWVAQCLEYDIAAQAKTLNDVQYEIQRVLVGRMFVASQFKIEPFEDVPPAPAWYKELLNGPIRAVKMELTPIKDIPVEIPQAYSLPKTALLVA
jgi:hypothetical protein